MKNILIIGLVAIGLAACTDNAEFSDDAVGSSSLTEQEARDLSPVGEVCVYGDIEEMFVPSNRGRGNNNGEWVLVDNRTYEPAFLYGDVDFDGVAGTVYDARLAVKQIYVKQIESEPCPAVADIGIFPQGKGADGFYTAEDIYQWNQIKHAGGADFGGETVCLSQCEIINHMSPEFKHNR